MRPWVLAAAGAGLLIEMLAALPIPSIGGLIFGIFLLGCEALAEDASAQRENAERWFRELMTAALDDDQRSRLNALAPSYLGAPSGPD